MTGGTGRLSRDTPVGAGPASAGPGSGGPTGAGPTGGGSVRPPAGRPGRGGARRPWPGWTATLVVGVAAVAFGLAGCGADSGRSDSKANGAAAPAMDAGKADGAPAAPNAAAGAGQVLTPEQVPVNQQRQVIYAGDLTLRVSAVDEAAGRLAALATGSGGYVSADQRSEDAERSSATITVRIPADKFDATLTAISKLGTEQNRKISSQDVTSQVVDLDSRLKTQQASVDRIRALLAQAHTIAEITSVEGELNRREADLESLKAQLTALTNQTALSTITVYLLGPDAEAPAKPKAQRGFLHGLSAGWHGFLATLSVLLTALGAVLPFALAIGAPIAAVLWYRRRRARLHPPVAPPPGRSPVAVGAPAQPAPSAPGPVHRAAPAAGPTPSAPPPPELSPRTPPAAATEPGRQDPPAAQL